MDYAAFQKPDPAGSTDEPSDEPNDARAAPRFTLFIRPAKIVCSQGEFVCVIRDVSSSGVSIRLFHELPGCPDLALELQGGQCYDIKRVWQRDGEAGFEFAKPIDVNALIVNADRFPKRGLRLQVQFPVTVATLTQESEALVENISQQGARIHCDTLFAIDQAIRLGGEALRPVRAKVRWRRDNNYGVVFDDTFSLAEFAELAASIQAPSLLARS